MVVLHMVAEMPSISASTMPAGAMGGPMAADDVGPPIIPSTPSQDAFAGIFSGANPQSIESLIEEMNEEGCPSTSSCCRCTRECLERYSCIL